MFREKDKTQWKKNIYQKPENMNENKYMNIDNIWKYVKCCKLYRECSSCFIVLKTFLMDVFDWGGGQKKCP